MTCVRSSNKKFVVVSRIGNSRFGQAVIVVMIIVSVKCEQWNNCSASNKEFLGEVKHEFVFTWFAINGLIYKRC